MDTPFFSAASAQFTISDPAHLIIWSAFADNKQIKWIFPCNSSSVCLFVGPSVLPLVFVLFVPSQRVCKLCMHPPDYPLAPQSPHLDTMEI